MAENGKEVYDENDEREIQRAKDKLTLEMNGQPFSYFSFSEAVRIGYRVAKDLEGEPKLKNILEAIRRYQEEREPFF